MRRNRDACRHRPIRNLAIQPRTIRDEDVRSTVPARDKAQGRGVQLLPHATADPFQHRWLIVCGLTRVKNSDDFIDLATRSIRYERIRSGAMRLRHI
jgi:hypothetical protein